MHRTYSMRQSRAPTQSQIEKPPPPPSSTKVGRLFGGTNFGHNLRKSVAGSYGPDLARKLSQLVKMEKNLMRSMELVGRERREVARQLSIWGEECDEDVSDITDKLGVLMFEIGELEDQYIDRHDQYRVTIKSIRNIEASVQPSRDRKQKITDQIAQLKYKDPNSPKIVVLEQELVRAEAESLVAEAQLSNITREKIKAAFTYQFDALKEHSEKVAMIAGYGKYLLELVDDTPVTPGETREAYDGYEASKSIIQDCEDSLTNWVESKALVRPTLSVRGSRPKRTGGRASRARAPVNLADQDRPMDDHGWVPAHEHERARGTSHNDDEEEYEDVTDEEDHAPTSHTRRSTEEDREERSRPTERRHSAEKLVAQECQASSDGADKGVYTTGTSITNRGIINDQDIKPRTILNTNMEGGDEGGRRPMKTTMRGSPDYWDQKDVSERITKRETVEEEDSRNNVADTSASKIPSDTRSFAEKVTSVLGVGG